MKIKLIIIYFLLPHSTFSIKIIKKLGIYKKSNSFLNRLTDNRVILDNHQNNQIEQNDQFEQTNVSDMYESDETIEPTFNEESLTNYDYNEPSKINKSTNNVKEAISFFVSSIIISILFTFYIYSQSLRLAVTIITFFNPYTKFINKFNYEDSEDFEDYEELP